MKRTFLTALFLLTAATLFSAEVKITVIQTTDIHGEQRFASLARLIAQERKADPQILLVDCGDLSRGSQEAYTDGGAASVEMLNFLKYDVWVPGNHEFRIGQKLFRRNLDLFKSGDVLAANLAFTREGIAPERPILPWKMFERYGLRIAVIGLVSPHYDYWFNTSVYDGMELLNPGKIMAKTMEEIRKAKADVVIIAGHLDFKTSTEVAAGKSLGMQEVLTPYPEISLFLAGHTHRTLPATEVMPNLWTVQPPIHATAAAKITMTFDKKAKKVTSVTSEFLTSKNVEPLEGLPQIWYDTQKAAAQMKTTPIVQLPESLISTPGKNTELQKLFARSVAEAVNADAAIVRNYMGRRKIKNPLWTRMDFKNMIGNEYSISTITLTPAQLKLVLTELKPSPERVYGLDLENLPEKNVTVAFDAYDITGCDGAYPLLRAFIFYDSMYLDHYYPRSFKDKLNAVDFRSATHKHHNTNVRDAFMNFMIKNFPVKK